VRFSSDVGGVNVPMFTEARYGHLVALEEVPLGSFSSLLYLAGKQSQQTHMCLQGNVWVSRLTGIDVHYRKSTVLVEQVLYH